MKSASTSYGLGTEGHILSRLYCSLFHRQSCQRRQIYSYSLPLIGHMYVLGRNPVEVLHDHKKKYGDIFRLDDHTIYIQGFSFDGHAPNAVFWSDGIEIPYYTRNAT